MLVLIVADDLTGALDSAVTLTGAGLRCVVARRPGDVAKALSLRPDVLSICTGSREGSAEAARAAVIATLDAIGALPEIVFKKVDSRLKGHVEAETAVLAERSGRRRALVAPAIPGQGRVVRGGRLTGAGVAVPIDVAAAAAVPGLTLEVPDIESDADLDRALARALESGPVLLVGASGLAAAVARLVATDGWSVPNPRLQAPVLLAIGSHDPITVAQVERLAETGGVAVAAAPDGVCPSVGGEGDWLLRLGAGEGRVFEAAAGDRFAAGIAQVVRGGGVGTLLGCGGETADAILGELGQGVLVIEGEVLPGVPVSSMVVAGRRILLVTKSGGFGDVEALVSVVAAARRHEGS